MNETQQLYRIDPRTVISRCARCDRALDVSHCTPSQYDAEMAAHHAVCPKRPIEVGETVQIVRIVNDVAPDLVGKFGPVVMIDQTSCPYAVKLEQGIVWCHTVERVPRPEAQAMVSRWRCRGSVSSGRQCPVTTLTPDNREHWLCDDHRPAATPAPALVDGIDREVCLARWMENRLFAEGGAAPPNAMTRMQRDVARVMWLERYGAARSAELRAKVAAGREAERCRVRVALEVEPWE